MQFYSITNNTWTTKASMPKGLNHANAAVVNGKIYVLGGLAETGNETTRVWGSVPDSWAYDPITDAWETIPGLPTGEERGSAAVGTYESKIYLAAGMSELELFEHGKQRSVSVVSIFDTKTRTWLSVPKAAKYIPEARDHAGAAVVGSKMYVLGGRDSGQENLRDTVFVLDLCDLEAGWKTSSARMPTARGGVAAGVIGKNVYVFGGEGNVQSETGVFDQVEVYDTVRDRWAKAGKMTLPRHGTYAVGVKGKVYIPGGGVSQSGAPVSDFDVFVP
jgi:N-acetylneuraminic acid mutarotase